MFPNHFAVVYENDIHIYDCKFNKQSEWKGHRQSVWCLIQVQDGRIASGSNDNTIRIWNEDGTSIEWKGHTNTVTRLIQLKDGRIASGSRDETIRIWKRADASGDEDGNSIEWKGHTGSVWCLIQLQDGRIASGSADNTIRIWNLDGTSIKWKGHTDWVCCLIQLHDGRIVSGSGDNTIRIWKRADANSDEDGTSIEWKGHTNDVICLLQLEDGRIASGSGDGTIRIWNVNDGSSIKLKDCKISVRSLLQDERIIFTSWSYIHIVNLHYSNNSTRICEGSNIIPSYTKQDMQIGRSRLYELLSDYIVEDVKSIVYQYVKPL